MTVVHGLSLATTTRRWLGETPFVQVSTTWALTCPETVNQRPCMTRKIETWLSDSRAITMWLTTEADDQSSLHCIIIMSDHIGLRYACRGGGCSCTGQFGWALMIRSILSVDALLRIEKEVQHCWALAAMRAAWLQAAWNHAHWTMKLGVGEMCVSGKWTPVTLNVDFPQPSENVAESDLHWRSKLELPTVSWWRGTVVKRRSLTGELSLSCARPAADRWPLTWVSHPLQVSQLGQLSLSSFLGR